MSVDKIIRAWKDEDFRQSLSAAERALLPDHPAGLIDLTAAELDHLTGGAAGLTMTMRICNVHGCGKQ